MITWMPGNTLFIAFDSSSAASWRHAIGMMPIHAMMMLRSGDFLGDFVGDFVGAFVGDRSSS